MIAFESHEAYLGFQTEWQYFSYENPKMLRFFLWIDFFGKPNDLYYNIISLMCPTVERRHFG